MHEMNRIHVGGYEAWMEDGNLTLHYHRAGQAGGFSVKLSAEETLGLLDLLAHNQDSVHHAVALSEEQRVHNHPRRSHDQYTH